MLYRQLPIELFSRIAKEALNMQVKEYGPSEEECIWCLQPCNPNHEYTPRVSEVLSDLDLPPLSCIPCENLLGRPVVSHRSLYRTQDGIPHWQDVCPECGQSDPY